MNQIAYLYVNGLGNGKLKLKDRLAQAWWRHRGIELKHARINWYDLSYEEIGRQTNNLVSKLLKEYSAVVIIGTSAGGSLALNTFTNFADANVAAVLAHARLREGSYNHSSMMSLENRAHLGTNRASEAFVESVRRAEASASQLTEIQKTRLLTLTQLTDLVVDTKLMTIKGVRNRKSLMFGHSGGYFAHLFADRDLIISFVDKALLS